MKKIFILTLLVLSFVACKKDETGEAVSVEGKWSLIFFQKGTDTETYEKGSILWEFNKYKELVVEINTNLNNSKLPITKSGTYKYVAAEEAISIENTQYAISMEDDNILVLDHNSLTGGTLIRLSYVGEK